MKMKKVLIATTNFDKFKAVSKIFENTIFPKDKFEIISLADVSLNIKEEKETGANLERARMKAHNAWDAVHESEYDFDYVVGLDDAIRIRGTLEPNIKLFIHKVLFEHLFEDGEEYAFNRAYVIIDKTGKVYETAIDLPYIYHDAKGDVELKDHTYPLSVVAYPLGSDKPICELCEQEEIDYYLKYTKNDLCQLGRFFLTQNA